MPLSPRSVRLLAVATAVCALVAGFSIRTMSGDTVDGSGSLAQHSGTALYASVMYAVVVFVWPRMSPLHAGAVAVGICWLLEAFQLTGVPADLSDRSLLARLALGVQFDLVDVAWYPAGVAPLVALHWPFRARGVR